MMIMVIRVGKMPDCRQMTGRMRIVPPIIAFMSAIMVRVGF